MSTPKNSEKNTEIESIAAAAGEWVPDVATELSVDELSLEELTLAPEAASGPVTFVMDPYGIKTLEISDAQNQENLDLGDSTDLDTDLDDLQTEIEAESAGDADAPVEPEAEAEAELPPLEFAATEETDAQLERLSQSIAADEAQASAEQQEAEAQLAKEQAELLAAQIAEDEALARAAAEEAEKLAQEETDPELLAALPQRDEEGNLDIQEMQSCIEALLFMLDKPVSAEKLQELLTASPEAEKPEFNLIQEALTALKAEYRRPCHGFELVEVAHGYQFRTKPGRAALAKKLAKIQTQRLSSGAMETLAIIAYKQPVLKEDVDKVRGVDSSHFIRGLLDKKLISISGRSDLPGRPMLYATTRDFLELFGLRDLQSMPPLHELEQMVPSSQSDTKDARDEDPRVVKMRKLVSEMNSDQTRLEYNPREDEVILKEIRDRVSQIATSTPYLDEQKAIEKAVALAKAEGREIPEDLTLLLNKPEPAVVKASEPGASE
jgi:segregation and condensation protein B